MEPVISFLILMGFVLILGLALLVEAISILFIKHESGIKLLTCKIRSWAKPIVMHLYFEYLSRALAFRYWLKARKHSQFRI